MTKTKTDRRLTPVDQQLDPEVLAFRQQFDDRSSLDQLVREGARKMLQEAINAEVDAFIDQHRDRQDDQLSRKDHIRHRRTILQRRNHAGRNRRLTQ